MPDRYDVILVGGGPSTRILNKFLHKLRPGIRTVVVRDEDRIVNHCGTPYIVEGEIPWERGLISDRMVTQFDTEILVDPLVGGDLAAHRVELASGRSLEFGQIVFATGTDQILPGIPGIELPGVLKVRRTEDVERAMRELEDVTSITVLGGGYIGLEFAISLRNMGKQVRLVEKLEHVMGGRIDPAMAEAIEAELTGRGIEVVLGHAATRLGGRERVERVVLDDGRELPCDAVIPAVGVRPMIEYAQALGLESSRGGLLVDEHFRTNHCDCFAIGDCTVSYCRVTGREVPGKLGSNAGQMARHLAGILAGLDARPYRGVLNAAVTRVGNLSYGAAGLSEADAKAIGCDVLVGRIRSADRYDNMPHKHDVDVKVIYRASDRRLIGGEILGDFNPAGYVESLAQLIDRETTLDEVVRSAYASHPELTPKTNQPYWVGASEALYLQHHQRPWTRNPEVVS